MDWKIQRQELLSDSRDLFAREQCHLHNNAKLLRHCQWDTEPQ